MDEDSAYKNTVESITGIISKTISKKVHKAFLIFWLFHFGFTHHMSFHGTRGCLKCTTPWPKKEKISLLRPIAQHITHAWTYCMSAMKTFLLEVRLEVWCWLGGDFMYAFPSAKMLNHILFVDLQWNKIKCLHAFSSLLTGEGRASCFPYGKHWSNTYVEGGWKGPFNQATRWSWSIASLHCWSVCCTNDGSGSIPYPERVIWFHYTG